MVRLIPEVKILPHAGIVTCVQSLTALSLQPRELTAVSLEEDTPDQVLFLSRNLSFRKQRAFSLSSEDE